MPMRLVLGKSNLHPSSIAAIPSRHFLEEIEFAAVLGLLPLITITTAGTAYFEHVRGFGDWILSPSLKKSQDDG
jgi:hypothetical protein